eukprot:gene9495-1736_t
MAVPTTTSSPITHVHTIYLVPNLVVLNILLSRDCVGTNPLPFFGRHFDFDEQIRDVFYQGSCDDGVRELARCFGWESEFNDLIATVQDEIAHPLSSKDDSSNLKILQSDSLTSFESQNKENPTQHECTPVYQEDQSDKSKKG